MRILLAEDDAELADFLKEQLSSKRYGHIVDVAGDGEDAWELAQMIPYDIVISDVILPKLDGISFCRRMRSHAQMMPILLMTGRPNSNDKVLGLDAGADDYILKPFDIEELAARIRALLRRGNSASAPLLVWGELQIDPSSCQVQYAQKPIHLTPKEYGLLELLLRNPKRMFSRSDILDHLWTFDDPPEEDTVKAHIKGLRQKLKRANAPGDFIETVYGLGYRLKPLAESVSKNEQIGVAISTTWHRLREKILGRLTTIEQATTACLEGSLAEELRQHAYQEAHKLAGSLGIFGFMEGSRLAQQIECQFETRFQDPWQAMHLSRLVVALHRELQMVSPTLEAQINKEQSETKLLIVATDAALIHELVAHATLQHLRTQIVESIEASRESIAHERPDAVLIDLSISEPLGLIFLAELAAQIPPVPTLVLAEKDCLADRVNVARLGGRTFLPKPIAIGRLEMAIDQLFAQIQAKKARILAVDHDSSSLNMLRQVLEPWGFHVYTLDDSKRFWEVLQGFSPDLLILNVEMPSISGLELCQVVRNDLDWGALPIVLLTAEADTEMIRRALSSGADDYLSKPINEPELVTCLLNRLERIWLLRNMTRRDGLTKTFSRRRFLQELDQFLRLAKHNVQPLCLALVKVDNFKQLNIQQVSAVGDQVLKQIGTVLLNMFQEIDIVGRWDGSRFVIAMYGLNRQEGYERLILAMENLRKETFLGQNGETLQITCSFGLVLFPEDGDQLLLLCQAVEQALESGRSTKGVHS